MANKVFDGLSGFFGDVGRARNAANIYKDLSGLSDASLTARGLKRDQLASYAFERAFKK